MKRAGMIFLFTLAAFIVEFVLYDFLGNSFHPNLILLLLIFFHVRLGFVWGLTVALIGGILKDSFSPGPWGVHVVAYLICVFLIAPLKALVYQKGYGFSRLFVALLMSLISAVLVCWLYIMRGLLDGTQPVLPILISEVWATALLSIFTFHSFKKCVLRLSA